MPTSATKQGWKSGRRQLTVAGAILALSLSAACGDDTSASGDDSGPIVIGTVAALSGQPAGLAKTYLDGMRAYVGTVNDNGGVNGRQIDHILKDDGFEIPRAVAGLRELAQRDNVVAYLGAYGSSLVAAIQPVVNELEIPMVGPMAYSDRFYDPTDPYFFPLWPGYGTMVEIETEYVIEELGAQRLAVLARSEDVGDESIDAVQRAAADAGVEVLNVVRYELGTTDYVPVLQQATDGDPDALIVYGSTVDLGKMVVDLQRVDWDGIFADTVGASSPQLIQAAGDAAEGVYGLIIADVGESTEGWDDYVQALDTHGDGADPTDTFTVSGYVAAQVLVAALETIEGEVTPESVRAALESQPFPTLVGPIEFTQERHLGLTQVQLTRIENGVAVGIGSPIPIE